jgi:hypothetical protein
MDRPYEDTGAVRDRRLDYDEARPSIAAPLLGIGGLGLVIGSLLTWIDASDAAGAEVNGGALPDGRLAMGIGFALLVMAAYMATTRRHWHWYDADLLGATLATIATTVIVATWVAIPEGQSPDLGLYVSLAGAVVALGGALAALAKSRTDADDDRGNANRVS